VRRALALLSVSAVVLSACATGAAGGAPYAAASGPMPAIVGPTLSGGELRPSDYRGRFVVVNFWNPDCPPCRAEAPALAASWDRLRQGDVEFIGVMYVGGGWPDDRDAARRFTAGFGITYPTVVDEGSRLAHAFAIPGIPVTVVADRSGRLAYRILGPVRPGEIDALVSRLSGALP